jgi:hypothetical protein
MPTQAVSQYVRALDHKHVELLRVVARKAPDHPPVGLAVAADDCAVVRLVVVELDRAER